MGEVANPLVNTENTGALLKEATWPQQFFFSFLGAPTEFFYGLHRIFSGEGAGDMHARHGVCVGLLPF